MSEPEKQGPECDDDGERLSVWVGKLFRAVILLSWFGIIMGMNLIGQVGIRSQDVPDLWQSKNDLLAILFFAGYTLFVLVLSVLGYVTDKHSKRWFYWSGMMAIVGFFILTACILPIAYF